jgi:hypothetical protein
MPKAVITLNYRDYVMEPEEAMYIAEVLSGAKQYKSRGYGDTTSYHIWEEPMRELNISVISDELVRVATIAGKPEKE